MSKSFLRSMSEAINLFPQERDVAVSLPSYSNEEVFKKDLEQIGSDIFSAIKSIDQNKNSCNHNDDKEIEHSTQR